ncbi:MAG: Asp-tRNA(Asn)/Glu-tRNA(Gln) amidotransferase subunit GatC [Patescibacteria group bacterium]
MISKEEVKHIAKLARLGLTEEEIEKFQKELSSILDYIEKLKEVDVFGVEPASHAIPARDASHNDAGGKVENVMRGDEIKPLGNKNLLDLAPDKKDGFLKVKSVF